MRDPALSCAGIVTDKHDTSSSERDALMYVPGAAPMQAIVRTKNTPDPQRIVYPGKISAQ
ncbi:hypothetical protein BA177_16630 [Woeseia oceani]|uniref:Uncharacterized protein n=1 Tax=Woeseia oceani TaxID=1548547 RepID=A0A193LJ79_9GAMM|nr:hypothetical protein BA177_16630 [Woeseia oceani]